MYASQHGAVGASIVVAAAHVSPDAALVAAVPAFVSHWFVDWVGEAGFPSKTRMLIWEVIPAFSFALAAWFSGVWWLFALGWLAGNMMDIIDKRFYLAPLLGWKFGMLFHRGNPPRFHLTLPQTKATAVIAALAPWGLALSFAV